MPNLTARKSLDHLAKLAPASFPRGLIFDEHRLGLKISFRYVGAKGAELGVERVSLRLIFA
nr:hypothetical protein [Fimbriimonas ginsengisoli]